MCREVEHRLEDLGLASAELGIIQHNSKRTRVEESGSLVRKRLRKAVRWTARNNELL